MAEIWRFCKQFSGRFTSNDWVWRDRLKSNAASPSHRCSIVLQCSYYLWLIFVQRTHLLCAAQNCDVQWLIKKRSINVRLRCVDTSRQINNLQIRDVRGLGETKTLETYSNSLSKHIPKIWINETICQISVREFYEFSQSRSNLCVVIFSDNTKM